MNTALFRSHMAKHNDTQTSLAEAMGLVQSAVSQKVNGKVDFKQSEINFIRARWGLSEKETVDIFFADEVSGQDTAKGA